ncbi:MAG: hypothetical protein ACI8X5_000017 [Planctomycetota bacterium]|jgi:hypothetical protein
MSRLTAQLVCRSLEILVALAAFQWALVIQSWTAS